MCSLDESGIAESIRPGDTVALAVGSRGISGIGDIVAATAGFLRSLGATPFIVPAMGSHGGATAEGQAAMLRRLGVLEYTTGCEIRSSIEVHRIEAAETGFPVFMDRVALESDHLIVINRVKPHTCFAGRVESGLIKMCLIGLGKTEGARVYHREIEHHTWERVWRSAFGVVRERSPLRLGIAVVENAAKQTAIIRALRPDQFIDVEPVLLARARDMMPGIPFREIDLLVVDEIGKDISGTGMDTNVIGRKEGLEPIARHIFVRDLTPGTAGNALGIGFADFTTKRLVGKIDFIALNANALTAFRTEAARIPITYDTDREAVTAAREMAGSAKSKDLRLVWIKNTLDIGTMVVSESLIEEAALPGIRIVSGPHEIVFDPKGNLEHPDAAFPQK